MKEKKKPQLNSCGNRTHGRSRRRQSRHDEGGLGEKLYPHAAPQDAGNANFDADVVEWFKSQGHSYQARMNAVLRHHMEVQRKAG